MNKEDIIKLAQKAGFDTDLPVFKDGSAIALKLAALVAAAEREACETIADAEASSWGGFDSGFTASVNIAAAIRARGNT